MRHAVTEALLLPEYATDSAPFFSHLGVCDGRWRWLRGPYRFADLPPERVAPELRPVDVVAVRVVLTAGRENGALLWGAVWR